MSEIELCEEQQKQIRSFLGVVRKIKSKEIFKDGLFASNLQMKLDANTGVYTESISGPNKELLASALLEIRKLMANDEPANLTRLHNMLYQKLEDETLKRHIGEIYKTYKALMKDGPPRFSLGINPGMSGRIEKQTPTHALDLFINGIYFHEDEDKRNRLQKELCTVKVEMRFLFLIAIRIVVECALLYEDFIIRNIPDPSVG